MSIVKLLKEKNRARILRKRAKRDATYAHHLVVLGLMKNEAFNIVEWVEHYLWQGADHIYLVDNGSTDNSLKLIEPYIARGVVSVMSRHQKWRQEDHYWAAIQKYKIRATARWLMVVDLDEFWFAKDGNPVAELLRSERYDGINGIYCNWTIFGSSGYNDHPPSLREHLTLRDPEQSLYTKWIARTKALKKRKNIDNHKLRKMDSAGIVSEQELMQLNHYITQSRKFFETVKMTRGDARIKEREHDWRTYENYFTPTDERCTQTDTRLADLIAQDAQKKMAS